MTYSAFEESTDDGSPLEVYQFIEPAGQRYDYCSGDINVSFNGITCLAIPIVRDSIVVKGLTSERPLKITVPRDNPLAMRFVQFVPNKSIALQVHRFHRGDLTGDLNVVGDSQLVWGGTIKSVTWEGSNAIITCGLLVSALQRQGPTKLYQRLCPHMLYDAQCAVLESEHNVVGVITIPDVNEPTVFTMAEASGAVFKGGYALRNGNEFRSIKDQVTNTITLVSPYNGLETGETIQIFKGCDRAIATCNTVFDNVANYGGFPYIPIKNPYEVGLED